MKRWGYDWALGMLSIYLGPASVVWTWGPGGFGFTAFWIFARSRAIPRLSLVRSPLPRECSICRGVHGPEIEHACE